MIKNLPYKKSSKLLNIDNNAKTVKGQKKGYKTAILYLDVCLKPLKTHKIHHSPLNNKNYHGSYAQNIIR